MLKLYKETKQVYKIDDNGFYVEPVLVSVDEELTEDLVEIPFPNGLYRPQWTGSEWIEGATQEEIDNIKNQQPEPNEVEKIKQENENLKQHLTNTENALLSIMDTMIEKGGIS